MYNIPLHDNDPPLRATRVTADPDTVLPKFDLVGAKVSPEERMRVENVLKKRQNVVPPI